MEISHPFKDLSSQHHDQREECPCEKRTQLSTKCGNGETIMVIWKPHLRVRSYAWLSKSVHKPFFFLLLFTSWPSESTAMLDRRMQRMLDKSEVSYKELHWTQMEISHPSIWKPHSRIRSYPWLSKSNTQTIFFFSSFSSCPLLELVISDGQNWMLFDIQMISLRIL